jgi:hypothetical protein
LSEYADRWAAPLLMALLDDPSLRVAARQDHDQNIPNTLVIVKHPETHRAHGSLYYFLGRFGLPGEVNNYSWPGPSVDVKGEGPPHDVDKEMKRLKTWWTKHGADFLAGVEVPNPQLTSPPFFYSAGFSGPGFVQPKATDSP